MKNILVMMALIFSMGASAALTAEQKTALDKQIEMVKGWASNATIVAAVKAGAGADYATMTQDAWKALPVLDAKVRALSKTPAAEVLKKNKSDAVSEAFLNAADGTKVALLSKTSNWSHKGKAKHDDPMAGKTWIGDVEVDESTGAQQIQIAVPVMDAGKAVGSLCVGFTVSKLK